MPIGWTPDSNTNCDEFWGNLDGQGYTITGLTIHNPTNVQTGLFGWVKGQTGHEDAGVIRNLKVEEPDVWGRMERGHTYDGKVGVIAGQTNYGATIENCNVIGGSVRGGLEEEPTQSVGGILGYQVPQATGSSIVRLKIWTCRYPSWHRKQKMTRMPMQNGCFSAEDFLPPLGKPFAVVPKVLDV